MHPEPKGGDGKAIAELMSLFKPATPIDYDLLLSYFLTLVWGGEPGQRLAYCVLRIDLAAASLEGATGSKRVMRDG